MLNGMTEQNFSGSLENHRNAQYTDDKYNDWIAELYGFLEHNFF